jgi:L-asparaginase / beta-aspartyl-peptidase
MQNFTLAIHGGAGTILKQDMTPELENAYREALNHSLAQGYKVLENKGTALQAVEEAIISLEDNPLFNAGRGSVFTKKGVNEMDAAIMNGQTLEAGAVAGVRNIKNPIVLARHTMLHSGHVFLAGKGANDFAIKQGIAMESDDYFFTQHRYDQWVQLRDSEYYQLDHSSDRLVGLLKDKKFGTVGAVACDEFGNVAAGTSTGGMTNKRFSRIGDSPVIGAGTYANNNTCAISCTGHGEPFIRAVVAHDISAHIDYKGFTLQQACEEVVLKKLPLIQGDGGVIGVDAKGNFSLVFNSAGMYRAVKSSNGTNFTAIYGDDNQ